MSTEAFNKIKKGMDEAIEFSDMQTKKHEDVMDSLFNASPSDLAETYDASPEFDTTDYGEETEEFSKIDVDVTPEMLQHLITLTGARMLEQCQPCSYDIWQERVDTIDELEDLHYLIGECIVNDKIVDCIVAGIANMPEFYYYRPDL